jgi:hypothetical protein
VSTPSRNGHALRSLRNVDLSDRELMLRVLDIADADGWTTSKDLAAALNLQREYPHRYVSARLGWLARRGYGAVERELARDPGTGNVLRTAAGKLRTTQRWRLTPTGEALARGNLRAAERRALEGLSEDQLLVAMRVVTQRLRGASTTPLQLAKREWRYGMAPERDTNGSLERPL